jgi:sporulation protein YlmC with PRC-barrel domain
LRRFLAVLHKASKLNGTAVQASDGEVGTVQDLYFDRREWRVKYLAVKTSGAPHDVVLVAPSAVRRPWNTAGVPVALTRDEVNRSSPDVLPSDRHLMSSRELNGLHIEATDGEIGHVDDVLVDEDNWNIRYVVLDTSNWIGGRSVVISPRVLKEVDLPDRIVRVDVARDDVRRSPALDSIEVGPGEDAPPFAII